jgi:hypothetical protein
MHNTNYNDVINQETISLHFSDLKLKENINDLTVDLHGTNAILMKYNHYILPTRIETFTYPYNTKIIDVKCEINNLHEKHISRELNIAPEPVILGYNNYNNFIKSETSPIAVSSWFDYKIGTGIINDEKQVILDIQIYPVHYNPTEKVIEWAENIEINIEYVKSDHTLSQTDNYDFIILCPNVFEDELEDLIEHKNSIGIRSKLVTLNEINDGSYFPVQGRDEPEVIKYFIKNAIEGWGIDSVLLVGGYEAFPTRMTNVYLEYFDVDEPFISDLYYADIYDANGDFSTWDTNENDLFAEYDWGPSHAIDDLDLYPDVYLGRLACINETEVIICVNKIINYETSKAWSQEWFTNLVVIGGDTFTDDNWGVNEGEYVNENVMGILSGFIPDIIWESNSRLHGPTPSGINEISNAINNGCGFVDFSGHGDPYSWAAHPNKDESTWLPKPWGYLNSHVAKLTNADKLPIVILEACSTCKFNVIENCLGWSFLSNPNGGGIASFGVTTFGYANGGGRLIDGGFIGKITKDLFESYKENTQEGTILTIGKLWSNALINYISSNMEVRDYATIESFQSFGDPTLMISAESQTPQKPSKPTGPSTFKPETVYSFSTSTIDPDGDNVFYLFNWGDEEVSGWLGPFNSGVIINASHSWDNKGFYQVRVKAKDVNGVQSDWSDPLRIIMPKYYIMNPLLKIMISILEFFPIFHTLIS